MEAILSLLGPILEELLSLAASATSGQVQNIINMVEKYVQLAVNYLPALIPSLQNIITALQGNGQITPEQVAELQAQSDAVDAALDAAAKDDGLSGV